MTTCDDSPGPSQTRERRSPPRRSVRGRLLAVVTLALSPLLALSAVQAIVEFENAAEQRRTLLGALATDAARSTEHAIQGARVLLEALAAQDDVRMGGPACVRLLRNAILALTEYSNLAYVTPDGNLACSAVTPEVAINVNTESWFQEIQGGESFVVGDAIVSALTSDIVVTSAVPVSVSSSGAPGALVASLRVSQIQSIGARSTLPRGTQVALVDGQGRVIEDGARLGEPLVAPEQLAAATADGVAILPISDAEGVPREIVIAPLVEDDLFVVLTSPVTGLFAWFWLDAVGRLLIPVTMWVLAVFAVWLATHQLILRWLTYLGRIAELYGEGRLDLAPTATKSAPGEIRNLALSMEAMAQHLAELIAQKESLLTEVHHRVKNNLQIIVSLLNIQSNDANPEAKAAINAAKERIYALSQVHKSLYESPNLDRVHLPSFFRDLTEHLSAASGAQERSIRVTAKSDDVSLNAERAASVALFVIEAVTNSFKHAFDEDGGTVRVSARVRGQDTLVVAVEDSGRGVGGAMNGGPGDTSLKNGAPASEGAGARTASGGIGAQLMTAFARQLGGEIRRSRSRKFGGARVSLVFPIAGRARQQAAAEEFDEADGTDGERPRFASSRDNGQEPGRRDATLRGAKG